MNCFLVTALLLISTYSVANTHQSLAHQQITSIETHEIPVAEELTAAELEMINPDIGIIIGFGKELVALGESVYNLVLKGKATNRNRFKAINVIPKDPDTKKHIDPFDLEETSDLIKKRYVVKARNAFRQEVVTFEYLVLFQTATYQGKGKYIQNALIVPLHVRVLYGIDFSSRMNLISVANKGTKANPVASAVLNVNYSISSMVTALDNNDVFTITGNGRLIKE